MSLFIDWLSGLCPVQAEGTFDDNPFYFRARGGFWTLHVVPPGYDPVDASLGWVQALHAVEGGHDPWGGYMPNTAARAILHAEYRRFTRNQSQRTQL